MTTLPALRQPNGLAPDAARLWRLGDATGGIKGRGPTLGDPPVAGDLWVTTWGEDDFGSVDAALVLITQVHHDGRYVLACPVTPSETTPGYRHAYLLSPNLLGVPLVIHATLETGIAYETLHRRLGSGLDAFSLLRTRRAPFGEATSPLPVHETDASPEDVDAYVSELSRVMGALCEQHP